MSENTSQIKILGTILKTGSDAISCDLLYPLTVPLHAPLRYCPTGQSTLEHVVHLPDAVKEPPSRNTFVAHVGNVAHVYPLTVPLQLPDLNSPAPH